VKKTGLKTVQSQSLVDLAYEQILEGITNGTFKEGSRIVIDTIADELGISRIPVREALARLHAQHLLEYERNKGYNVLPKFDYKILFQARLIIEPSAIQYSDKELSDDVIKKLRDINQKISKLSSTKKFKQYFDFFVLNDDFHSTIVSLCNNRLISEAYNNLSYGPQWARHAVGTGIPDLNDNVVEHEGIINALEKGDINKAKDLSELHIINGMERFKNYSK
jgi:DNA-binding GntR family transcriptional regulator